MACSYCGQQYCSGSCLSINQVQGQAGQIIFQNPSLGAGGGLVLQSGMGTYPTAVIDTSLHNFLEVIADKDDTNACVAFLERQRATFVKQRQEIERLRKQYESDLEKAEVEFLSKCQKYRPSITDELLKRIKGLKAFF